MGTVKDERATSFCECCGLEFHAQRESVTTYFHGAETLALCEGCADDFERESERRLESDEVPAGDWRALAEWVKENREA